MPVLEAIVLSVIGYVGTKAVETLRDQAEEKLADTALDKFDEVYSLNYS